MEQEQRPDRDLQQPTSPPEEVAKERRAGKTWIAVVVSVLLAGVALSFVITDSLESAKYYLTIPEVRASVASLQGKSFRVAGKVVPGSLTSTSTSALPEYRFLLVEQGQELVVRYSRSLPDSFTDGVEVVVEGSLDPQGEFVAVELLARCPSKYEAERTPENTGPAAIAPGEVPGGHPTSVPRGPGQ
ncbi:MAG: cytochrome c maturation protein CcmE [Myxococcota bacterium]|jgi:cytochrome c-type biogenesis protein CcmE|nr:cytochrome c maturation protein CcmE [Myxococcota bacterium]